MRMTGVGRLSQDRSDKFGNAEKRVSEARFTYDSVPYSRVSQPAYRSITNAAECRCNSTGLDLGSAAYGNCRHLPKDVIFRLRASLMNILYYGSDLKILGDHIKDESVNLIYLDPPFNSNRNYNVSS